VPKVNKQTLDKASLNEEALVATASALMAPGKGLLAIDESTATCNGRFAALGILQNEEKRRAYRELIITSVGLGKYVSGVIFYDETIRQSKKDGTSFVEVLNDAGIITGIKVDAGTRELADCPGESITIGLVGLSQRLTEYLAMGARFAKWRAVFVIGDDTPSRDCIEENAESLAKYAALCQQIGLVPIVEPEVLMTGGHNLERCAQVTEEVLQAVFHHLENENVMLKGLILKPNMVLPGLTCPKQAALEQVARATVESLMRVVPPAVAGVAFLSGGQSYQLASARLNAINIKSKSIAPWPLTFSFARAIQEPALAAWAGDDFNVSKAQEAILLRVRCDGAARAGAYNNGMEKFSH